MEKRMNVTALLRSALLLLILTSLLVQPACKGSDKTDMGEGTTVAQNVEDPENTDDPSKETPEDLGTPKQYKTIFNSDTTHIMQCASPYHATNQDSPLTPKMVKAAVTEALDAGADCYVITPGHCWVPWWPSEYADEHLDWFFNELGGTRASNPFWNYVHIKGRDFIQEQIEVCREYGAGVFIDYRMNDAHMINKTTAETGDVAFSAEIFADHPEYAIGRSSDGRNEGVLDFRHEAVREYKLKLIRELIENYEIDGFELDFCRRFAFFNTDKTTKQERIDIMTEFVAEVRKMLDEQTAKDGRYRHLSVRIPIWEDYYGDMGINLAELEKAGVTIFNFTSSYFMAQNFNLKQLTRNVKDALVYCELHFITAVAYDKADNNKRIHRRSTEEQFYTTAQIAYEQGADGISFFNFQYYRGDRQGKGDEPLTEPPWQVISNVEDKEFLAKQAQYYYYGETWRDAICYDWGLPVTMATNFSESFNMYLVEPEGGWKKDGQVRLQSLSAFSGQKMTVSLNGTALEQIAYSGEPYENEYTQMIGEASNYLCYKVPLELLKAGGNTLTVKMTSGQSIMLCFVELTVA